MPLATLFSRLALSLTKLNFSLANSWKIDGVLSRLDV